MYQKIKAKFKASPTIFYACSIVASWAGVGSLMNFRTIALRYGAVPAIIWAVFNSLACITFGLFADRVPSIRRIMQSKVMFYFIGLLTLFQTWTQMSGIYEIFGDTPVGTKGGMIIVYVTCVAFLIMLLKDGMIRNVLSDGFSWVVVYGLLAVVVAAALVYTGGTFAVIDPGVNAAGIKAGVYNGLLLLPGPFACPYYYSLFEYNDKNADGTKRGNMKKGLRAGGRDVWHLHGAGCAAHVGALQPGAERNESYFDYGHRHFLAVYLSLLRISGFRQEVWLRTGCSHRGLVADPDSAWRYGHLAADEHDPHLRCRSRRPVLHRSGPRF